LKLDRFDRTLGRVFNHTDIAMNSEERRLLTDFLAQLQQVKGIAKDPDADALIAKAAAQQPDAVYLLVQKALLQEQALNAAKAQISQLQSQLQEARSRSTAAPRSGGFLSNNPWAAPARQAPAPGGSWPGAAPAQPGGFGGGMGSFLGTAAATAAGIAGGAFLFQGIENLMGHHGHGGGFFDTASGMGNDPIENVTINEYYGDSGPDRDKDQDFQSASLDDSDLGFDDYTDDDFSQDV
jgi:hypothetical protein